MRVVLANGEGRVGMEDAIASLRRDDETLQPDDEARVPGDAALEAVEQGIRPVEADPRIHSVGRGGHPNLAGEIECDAAIMNGATLECGAVAALRDHLHAVSVAREVMRRLPHVFLVGEGATRFAREVGAESAEMLTPEMRDHHERWVDEHVPADLRARWPAAPLAEFAWASAHRLLSGGTVVYLARDGAGNLAAASSTSGWARKYPGRVGDTPIIGAGIYADNRYGACGCTHTGEMMVRAGTARSVILYMKRGATVTEACHEAMADLRALRGGYTSAAIIHAIDRDGRPCVVSSHELGDGVAACYWNEHADEIQRLTPGVDPL